MVNTNRPTPTEVAYAKANPKKHRAAMDEAKWRVKVLDPMLENVTIAKTLSPQNKEIVLRNLLFFYQEAIK